MKYDPKAKIKHVTGIYINMPDAPSKEDILFFVKTKKLKTFSVKDLEIGFGSNKLAQIESSLSDLKLSLSITEIDDLGVKKFKLNA